MCLGPHSAIAAVPSRPPKPQSPPVQTLTVASTPKEDSEDHGCRVTAMQNEAWPSCFHKPNMRCALAKPCSVMLLRRPPFLPNSCRGGNWCSAEEQGAAFRRQTQRPRGLWLALSKTVGNDPHTHTSPSSSTSFQKARNE